MVIVLLFSVELCLINISVWHLCNRQKVRSIYRSSTSTCLFSPSSYFPKFPTFATCRVFRNPLAVALSFSPYLQISKYSKQADYSCFHFDVEFNLVKVAPRTLPG
jgi:hypothetical protein